MESETCLCKVQANRFGKIFALRFFLSKCNLSYSCN